MGKVKDFFKKIVKKKSVQNDQTQNNDIIKNKKNTNQISNEEKIIILNEKIDKIIMNKRKDLENVGFYDATYFLTLEILKNIKQNTVKKAEFTSKISINESKKIALDFFENLDEELYSKAEKIINGKNYKVGYHEFNKKNSNEKAGLFYDEFGKATIKVPVVENISDVSTIVRGVSYIFDIPNEVSISRRIFADVNSYCFERMLYDFLDENNLCNQNDVDKLNYNLTRKIIEYSKIYKIQYELVKQKLNNGNFEINYIKKIEEIFNMSLDEICSKLNFEDYNMEYIGRCPIAGVVSYQFLQDYRYFPDQSIEKLKNYHNAMKNQCDLKKLEKILDVSLSKDDVYGVVKQMLEDNEYCLNENINIEKSR